MNPATAGRADLPPLLNPLPPYGHGHGRSSDVLAAKTSLELGRRGGGGLTVATQRRPDDSLACKKNLFLRDARQYCDYGGMCWN